MQNETHSRQNRVLAPIALAASIIIAVMVLRPLYLDYIEKSTLSRDTAKTLETKISERDALEKIQAQFNSGATSDIMKRVEQLNKKFVVSDIMEAVMINDYTKTTLSSWARISIGNISVNKWTKLPNGLSLGQVSVGVSGSDMYSVIDFITYLTTTSPYAFTIDSISLPIDTDVTQALTNNGQYSLSLSLGLYYYE